MEAGVYFELALRFAQHDYVAEELSSDTKDDAFYHPILLTTLWRDQMIPDANYLDVGMRSVPAIRFWISPEARTPIMSPIAEFDP